MQLRVLGPFEAVEAGQLLEVGGRRQRVLLARLALERSQVVPVEALIDELWEGQPPARAKQALQSQVSRLRQALGGDRRLIARPPGYVLRLEPVELDAARFEGLVADASTAAKLGQTQLVADLLAEAEGCWRGPALAEFADYPFAHAEGARLDQVRVVAAEERITAELSLGHHAQVVAGLESLVGLHPLRERLWAHLILALYRSGRQADALRAYRQLRHTLGEELGIEPSVELVRLEEAVLLQKPELDWHHHEIGVERRHRAPGAIADRPEATGKPTAAASSSVGRAEELRNPSRGPAQKAWQDSPVRAVWAAAGKDQALSKRLRDHPEEVGREHGLRGAELVELIGSVRYGLAGLAEARRTSRVLLDIRAHRSGEPFPFAGLADAELAERGELAEIFSTRLWVRRGLGSDKSTDEFLGGLREWASALADEIRRRVEVSETVDLMLAHALIGAKNLDAATRAPSAP